MLLFIENGANLRSYIISKINFLIYKIVALGLFYDHGPAEDDGFTLPSNTWYLLFIFNSLSKTNSNGIPYLSNDAHLVWGYRPIQCWCPLKWPVS